MPFALQLLVGEMLDGGEEAQRRGQVVRGDVSKPERAVPVYAAETPREAMIRKGDRLQASEKIWGAVAHALKAVANERGWERDGHQRLRNVALHLQDHPAVDDPEIGTLLRSVEAFHRNFYNDNMAMEEISSGPR